MRVDILTIFPRFFDAFLTHGIVERARQKRALEVSVTNLRSFTEDRHRSVDDRPYGGGPGMLIKPEPVFRAWDLLGYGFRSDGFRSDGFRDNGVGSNVTPVPVLLCPQGETLHQGILEELSQEQQLLLLCGRYEGFDERICAGLPWRRYSIGNYVLAGGEIPAQVFVEGIARLLPGVLGHEESTARDSFSEWAGADGLDHPHFTRPTSYRGREVPPVLLSGNHGEIEAWRRRKAKESTLRAGERSREDNRSRDNRSRDNGSRDNDRGPSR